jgi:hypothetical protein
MNMYTTCITSNDVSKWGTGEGDELGMRKGKIRIEIKGLGFRNTCRSVHMQLTLFQYLLKETNCTVSVLPTLWTTKPKQK